MTASRKDGKAREVRICTLTSYGRSTPGADPTTLVAEAVTWLSAFDSSEYVGASWGDSVSTEPMSHTFTGEESPVAPMPVTIPFAGSQAPARLSEKMLSRKS